MKRKHEVIDLVYDFRPVLLFHFTITKTNHVLNLAPPLGFGSPTSMSQFVSPANRQLAIQVATLAFQVVSNEYTMHRAPYTVHRIYRAPLTVHSIPCTRWLPEFADLWKLTWCGPVWEYRAC